MACDHPPCFAALARLIRARVATLKGIEQAGALPLFHDARLSWVAPLVGSWVTGTNRVEHAAAEAALYETGLGPDALLLDLCGNTESWIAELHKHCPAVCRARLGRNVDSGIA